MKKRIKILFLCVGNSARSQIAEALASKMAPKEIECFSAGSLPKEQVHPLAVETMQNFGIDISNAIPKSWNEFAGVKFDYVVSLCEEDFENCPVYLSDAVQLRWQLPDPVDFQEDEKLARKVFSETILSIRSRLNHFISLNEKQGWREESISVKRDQLERFHNDQLIDEFCRLYKENLNVVNAIETNMICIHESDLRIVVRDEIKKENNYDLITPVSLLLTFILFFVSSDFKEFYFAKQHWETLIYLLAFGAITWCLISLVGWYKSRNTLSIDKRVVEGIKSLQKKG